MTDVVGPNDKERRYPTCSSCGLSCGRACVPDDKCCDKCVEVGQEFLENDVQLSNKPCPKYYGKMEGGEFVGRKNCSCPKDRCWYDEQVQRRADGKKAINPRFWR